jgi:hypothetical protein
MRSQDPRAARLLDLIVDSLDIPRSYYEKASARHKSLGEWMCRRESTVAAFSPHVSLQGSFRYGTVNRPLLPTDRYDLDNLTTLKIAKTAITQKQLKELYGSEVKAYAAAHNMIEPVEEKDRCWRLNYTDEVDFHLDTLPCLPEEEAVIQAIMARGVLAILAAQAVAITDRRHPQYDQITRLLLSSNPGGFAAWFEEKARPAAVSTMQRLVEARLYASVDAVPPYEWKTPLQRSIQILKRHRDVMFRRDPSEGPISMIITNLATHAYAGEGDLWSAVANIVDRMGEYVRPRAPRVPNPADPAEDYADKWAKQPSLEANFWRWHTQVKADLGRLSRAIEQGAVADQVRSLFDIQLGRDALVAFEASAAVAPAIITRPAPTVSIPSAPRPWHDRT